MEEVLQVTPKLCEAYLVKFVSYLGVLPWNAFPGKVCGSNLLSICKTAEVSEPLGYFTMKCHKL